MSILRTRRQRNDALIAAMFVGCFLCTWMVAGFWLALPLIGLVWLIFLGDLWVRRGAPEPPSLTQVYGKKLGAGDLVLIDGKRYRLEDPERPA